MIHSLTSLRWFAAFYVFLFHVQIRSGLFEHLPGDIVGGGYAGMCFFFVLSGFVLATRYGDGVPSYAEFVAARLARIYPAFIVAFLLTLPLIKEISIPLYWANALSNVFLLQAWTPNLWSLGINGGTWSLSVEMFFYLLFPGVLLLVQGGSSSSARLAAALAVLWFFSFLPGAMEFLNKGQDSAKFYYSVPIYRLPDFAIGVILAELLRRGKLVNVHLPVVLIAISLFFASCTYLDGMKSGNLTLLNLTAIPAVSALIVWATRVRPAWLEWRPLVYLGEISYGVYIYQFIFLEYLFDLFRTWLPGPYTFVVAGLVATLVVASLSFHLLENPVRRTVKSYLRKSPPA